MDTSTHIQDTENINDNIEDDEGEDEPPQWEVRSWLQDRPYLFKLFIDVMYFY